MTCKIKDDRRQIDAPQCAREQKDGRLLVLLVLGALILALPRFSGLLKPEPIDYQYFSVQKSGADIDGVYRAPASRPMTRVFPWLRQVSNNPSRLTAVMARQPEQPLKAITIDQAGIIAGTEPDPRLFFFFKLPVPVNRADVATLERIPGIGPVLANRIITFRQKHALTSPEQLDDIPGIGPSLTKKLSPYLTFE